MNISKFYRQSSCPKLVQLDDMIKGPLNRNYILSKQIRTVCRMLCTKESGEILDKVREELAIAYRELPRTFAWQEAEWLDADVGKVKRFLDYLTMEQLQPIAYERLVEQELRVELPDGSMVLSDFVSMLVQKDGGPVRALIIHPGKSERSMKGHSYSKKVEGDLRAIIAKLALEKEFPHIEIDVVYLSNDKDSGTELTSFLVNDTAKSNLHRITFGSYYSKEGCFEVERLLKLAVDVVASQTAQECDDCRNKMICQTPLFTNASADISSVDEKIATEEAKKADDGYRLPSYTDEQERVVQYNGGSMVVCAGPGSGKTATLVGRIYHLIIEEKVPPELILVVTFTKKAVGELKERCLGFLEECRLPNICTFHSFCYKVLRDNKRLLKNGKVNVLTEIERLNIIKNLVSVFPKMRGFNYAKEDGKYGLLKTIAKRIDLYEEKGAEELLNQYDCDESFFSFYEQYRLAVVDGGYLTFDQQVECCNALFDKHPELLRVYQDIYRYVMVDEYQDVNEEQVRLLYALTNRHRNLVVVGDDDQTIYGFRGSDSKFMIGFDKDFPEAQKVVLTKNFRSSKSIVEASKMLISNNQHRIAKDVESCKGDFGKAELPPVIVPSMDPRVIDELINSLIEEGYQYGDIGILSSQNKYLKALHKELRTPTVLSKSYLGDDAFFVLFYSVARLYLVPSDDVAAYQFFRLYDSSFFVERADGSLLDTVLGLCGIRAVEDVQCGAMDCSCPYTKAVNDLFNYFCVFGQQERLEDTIDTLLLLTNWKGSDVGKELKELVTNNGLETLSDMVKYLTDLMNYEPESVRVEFKKENKVTLITSHESKGKEYKVVIYRNDSRTDNGMEEFRRVVYVTITRPMERVYILQGEDTKFDISQEIDHILLEV